MNDLNLRFVGCFLLDSTSIVRLAESLFSNKWCKFQGPWFKDHTQQSRVAKYQRHKRHVLRKRSQIIISQFQSDLTLSRTPLFSLPTVFCFWNVWAPFSVFNLFVQPKSAASQMPMSWNLPSWIILPSLIGQWLSRSAWGWREGI